jgi:hypothetical protein
VIIINRANCDSIKTFITIIKENPPQAKLHTGWSVPGTLALISKCGDTASLNN